MIEASDKFHQVANGEIRPLDWSTDISFTKESLPYEIEGKTEQTTYTGKNKLSLNSTTKTQAGVTIKTDTNGVITLSGTATSNSDIYVIMPKIILTAGTYTFSYNRTPVGSLALNTSLATGGASWYFSIGYDGVAKTQTISSSVTLEMIEFSVVNGTNYNGVTLKPQLEVGSTATDFEPYVGGIASPNPDYPQEVRTLTGEQTIEVGGEEYKINLSPKGKNLFNYNSALIGKYVSSTGSIDSSSIGLLSDFIEISTNTNYYVSGRNEWNSIGLYNSDKQFISRIAMSSPNGVLNITTANCKYIRINARNNDTTLQLEEGNTATPFEPFLEPVELAKVGDYQDRIFKASGNNLINKEVIARSTNLTVAQTNTGLRITKNTASQYNFATLNLANSSSYYGKTLTLRLNISRSDTAVVPRVAIYWTSDIGSAGSWIANISTDGTTGLKTKSFNVPATAPNASYPNIGILLYPDFREQNGTWSQFDDIQLELGSEVGDYEPYGTDWYIEKETGKVILNGTENWNTWGTQISGKLRWALDYSQIVVKPSSAQVVGNILSDRYTAITQDLNYAGATTGIAIQTSGWIAINDTARNTDLTAWKTWLGSHPTSIYYALATPTYTKVTGPLLDQLNYIYSQNLDYLNVKNSVLSISTSRSIEFPYTIQTATCDISLDNSHHQYSHSADNEGLGRYILPNRPVKVGLGFKNAEIVPHFKGNTPSMPSYQGEREEQVTFTANDKLAVIGAKHLPNMIMARDSRTDEVIYQILTDLGIPESQFVLERGTNIIPFVYFDADKSVGNALKELVQAENGSLWQDEEGIIRFEARDTNAFDKDVAMVLDSTNIKSVQPSRTDSLVNQVNIVADVRQIEQLQPVFTADNASGYSSQSEADNYRVASNGSTTIWLSFEDPVWSAIAPTLNAGSQTSSFSVVNLSGQAVNSGVTAICTLFATSYKITFANTNAFPVSISSISIWGEPAKLVGGQAVEYMAVDDESVEKYGTYPLEITDNKCFGSVENIKRYAIDVLQKYADYNAVVKVTAKADPALQIGDIVQLAVGKFNGRYQVKGIETTLDNGGLTTTLTLNLSVTGDKTPFILNKSKLDSSNEVLG